MIDIHSQQTNVPPFPELIHINLSYNQVRLEQSIPNLRYYSCVHSRKEIFLLPVVHKQQNEFLYQ